MSTWTIRKQIREHLGRECGVTLTEMLVVLAILLIIIGGMTTLFTSASTTQIDQSNRSQAQQHARVALDSLRREIHCASAISPDPMLASVAMITLTLGPYCATGGTTLSSALTIPASGSYTVAVADASAWPAAAPYTIFVGSSPTPVSCTGKTATTFTTCTGGTAQAYALGSPVTGTTNITWCTKDKTNTTPPAAGGAPYSLWRYRGIACSGTGRKQADYLTDTTAAPAIAAGKVFVGYTAFVAGQLRALTVGLPVDVTPSNTRQRYILRDDIALRNSRGT